MARVHHRKARKDYPQEGIKKGDMYYYAKIKTGARSSRVIRSLTRPRPSQLTASAFLGQLGDLRQDLSSASTPDDFRDFAETLRGMGEECDESLQNMPEGLQMGSTGELLQERIDGCEAFAEACDNAAEELETALDDIDGMDATDLELAEDADETDIDDAREAKRREAIEVAISAAEEGDQL